MDYLNKLKLGPPGSESDLQKLRVFGYLPEDYLNLLRVSNGAEGRVGNRYLIIFSTNTVIDVNRAMSEFRGNLLIFGSDGGGRSYAFDKRDAQEAVVEIHSMDIGAEEPKLCGNSMMEFFEYLYNAG